MLIKRHPANISGLLLLALVPACGSQTNNGGTDGTSAPLSNLQTETKVRLTAIWNPFINRPVLNLASTTETPGGRVPNKLTVSGTRANIDNAVLACRYEDLKKLVSAGSGARLTMDCERSSLLTLQSFRPSESGHTPWHYDAFYECKGAEKIECTLLKENFEDWMRIEDGYDGEAYIGGGG